MVPTNSLLGSLGYPRSAQLVRYYPCWLIQNVYLLHRADRLLGEQPAPVDAAKHIDPFGARCESEADCQKKMLPRAGHIQEVWMGES